MTRYMDSFQLGIAESNDISIKDIFPNGTGASGNWKPNIRDCAGACSSQNSSA